VIHLTIQQLSSYLDSEASESSRSVVQDHLAVCDACSAKFARLEHQEEGLIRALTSDQDEAFFQQLERDLSDRIEARASKASSAGVPAAKLVAGASRNVAEQPPSRASAVTAREILEDRDLRSNGRPAERLFSSATASARPAKKSAFPWAAAITIFVIVGSVGAVNFGAEYASRWLNRTHSGDVHPVGGAGPLVLDPGTDAESPSVPAAPVAPGSVAVGSTTTTVPEPAPGAAPAQPVHATPAPSRPAAPFPSGSQAAATAPAPHEDESDSQGPAWKPDADEPSESDPSTEPGPTSAATYDAIATSIERKLPMLQGDDYRSARYRLAEARYNAWRLEPNGDRTAIVLRAIHAYLIGAPTGPDRDTATGWLSEVESSGY
jgi:Putative zinc-finger